MSPPREPIPLETKNSTRVTIHESSQNEFPSYMYFTHRYHHRHHNPGWNGHNPSSQTKPVNRPRNRCKQTSRKTVIQYTTTTSRTCKGERRKSKRKCAKTKPKVLNNNSQAKTMSRQWPPPSKRLSRISFSLAFYLVLIFPVAAGS